MIEHKAIEDYEGMCFKCLKKKDNIHIYHVQDRGYGSDFDSCSFDIQLCEECNPTGIEKWVNEQPKYVDYYETYQYENEIHKLIDELPIEGQELVLARTAYGASAPWISGKDWIDMQLGTLPDKKYEEYGYYSPRQIKAYHDRFPTCEHPINVIYSEDSKASNCPFGAMGGFNQKVDDDNPWDDCYNCPHYKQRNTKIKTMSSEEYDRYEKYIIGKQFEDEFKEIEEK